MSDEPNAQPAREPTLTSLLASIVRENRLGRTVRLVDPVRTHGHNPLKRAYVYAVLDSRGIMMVVGPDFAWQKRSVDALHLGFNFCQLLRHIR